MNWLIYHIASGHAFFTGVLLILVGVAASFRATPRAERGAGLSALIGGCAVSVSATPLAYAYYAAAALVTLVWLFSSRFPKVRRWASVATIAVWSIAAAMEIPYHRIPSLDHAATRSLTIIGDSVTAGMGGGDNAVRWPQILGAQHDVVIQDISHPGETTTSALKRVKAKQVESSLVVLEIGGNDLLGDADSHKFARDLDTLLAEVCASNRQVVMLELPLPPFRNEFGRIQRSLARTHKVALIPKRVFASVLMTEGSTVDTIHLSQTGHDRMAATVWELIKSAFAATE